MIGLSLNGWQTINHFLCMQCGRTNNGTHDKAYGKTASREVVRGHLFLIKFGFVVDVNFFSIYQIYKHELQKYSIFWNAGKGSISLQRYMTS